MTLTEVPLTNGDARKAVFALCEEHPEWNRDELSEALGGHPGPRRCGDLKAEWKATQAPATPAAVPFKKGSEQPGQRVRELGAAPRPRAAKAVKAADGTDDRLERWARLLVPWFCAGIALVMSYSHVRHLAITAGVAWPELLPLSIDGLMLAGWLCLRRHPRHLLAVVAVALGVAGSAALNAFAARPELVAMADVRLGAALAVPVSAVVAMHLALKR